MRILVLGGGGQVARAFRASAPAEHTVVSLTAAELDITDEAALGRLVGGMSPDWIVNGAAYTAVDQAEVETSRAFAVNDAAVAHLARCGARYGCRLLHLSTDFVFDGTSSRAYLPEAPVNPLSVYGASKLAGERRVLEGTGGHGLVLRTAWVYAATGRNFVLTMLRLMSEREVVKVVADQIGTPTWAGALATAMWRLIGAEAPGGIYQWTDLGVASWYDFALAIQEEALARGLLRRAPDVVPIASSEYPTKAIRPAFSVLDTGATRRLIGLPGHHWRVNLRKMLDELRTP